MVDAAFDSVLQAHDFAPFCLTFNVSQRPATRYPHAMRRIVVAQDLLNGEIITWDNSHINRLNPWLADRYLDTVILMMGLETEDDVMYQMLFKLLQMPSGISVKGRKRTNMFSSYLQIIQAVENTEGSVAVIPYTALDSQFVRCAPIQRRCS